MRLGARQFAPPPPPVTVAGLVKSTRSHLGEVVEEAAKPNFYTVLCLEYEMCHPSTMHSFTMRVL